METNEVMWPTWNDVLDWTMGLSPETVVGVTGSCEECILANYLHAKYPEWYFYINACKVNDRPIHADWKAQQQPFDWHYARNRLELPEGVNEIAALFDEKFGYGVTVTAAQFEQVFADRRVKP